MSEKPNFDKAEMLARELRLMQPTDDFRLEIDSITFDRDIYIDTFENYALQTNCPISRLTADGTKKDGYTIERGDTRIILYYENHRYEPRTKWTIVHEIGHIYMGHKSDAPIEEIEAHWFAAEFLMPTPIITAIALSGKKCTLKV